MPRFSNTLPPERLILEDLEIRSPLKLEWLGTEPEVTGGKRAEARLRLSYREQSETFLVEYKPSWTAAALDAAIKRVKESVQRSPGDLPLVVVPYLTNDAFDRLAGAGVNGLDLLGRCFISTEKWFLVISDGHANPFRNTQVIKSPYQGKSALVARALLTKPVLKSAQELAEHIQYWGGQVSQPVLSRALAAFRDDLVVGRAGGYGVVLLQPEKLLDRLAEGWKITVDRWQRSPTELWRGRVEGDPDDILRHLQQQAEASGSRCVHTGVSASLRHAAVASDQAVSVYADQLGSLLEGLPAESTRRFPNLYVLRAPDEAVYFGTQIIQGHRWPSLIQRYLELTLGDARLRGSAEVIRQELLDLLEEYKAVKLSLGTA